jgi:hypothetical protein
VKSSLSRLPIEAQSLRSHSLYFFVKLCTFLIASRVFGFQRIAAPQLFKRFLDREFVDFSHPVLDQLLPV